MRLIIMLLIATVCSQTNGFCQPESDIKLRFRIGLGAQLSSASSNMKDHLKKTGFGDKYNGTINLFGGGNDFYPQSQKGPLFFELAVERNLNKQTWIGIMAGIDQEESVKGYDRYGTRSGLFGTYSIGQFITLKHKAWFLSPQFSFESEDSKFGLYAGPSIDFHTLSVIWDFKNPEKKSQTKIGGMLGVRAKFVAGLEGFASYRFASGLDFEKSSSTADSNMSTLPAKRINFNNFRLGLSYRFSL